MKYLIHVEEIWKETNFNNLISFLKNNRCHVFLMPPQLLYQRLLNSYRGSEKELHKLLTERYQYLKELQSKYKFRVGLHIHFSLYPKEIPKKEKQDLLNEGYEFIKSIFGRVDGISFGWYKYDEYLESLCKEKDLTIIHWALFGINIHDYDIPLSFANSIERMIKDFLRFCKYKGNIGRNVKGN